MKNQNLTVCLVSLVCLIASASLGMAQQKSIAQTAIGAGNFNTAEAMGMLTSAIEQGVPAFNSGDHRRCCDIYQSTMTTLVDTGINGADSHTMSMISNTLTQAGHSTSETDRA